MAELVVVHGVGGPKPVPNWLIPLNSRLAALGYPGFDDTPDAVHVADYTAAFGATIAKAPVSTYVQPDDRTLKRLELEYARRQGEVQWIARMHDEGATQFDLDIAPRLVKEGLAFVADQKVPFLREVRSFLSSDAVRDEACRLVTTAFPKSGPVVVIAHSLGSLVTVRSLTMLPPEVTVELLVTIGSPLSFERYRNRVGDLDKSFPFGRVKAWLNVYAPLDPVCAGRGISSSIGQAVDACARLGASHDLRAYVSHPIIAATIGHVLFSESVRTDDSAALPARRVHPYWFSDLLRTAFSYQVAEGWKAKQWHRYVRLQHARLEVARRTVIQIEQARSRPGAAIADDGPLASGRYPSQSDLTDRSAQILNDADLEDDGLLVLAVALLMSPVAPPFDFEKWVDADDRRAALEHTFNVVRDRRGNLSDKRFAEQVDDSMDWARGRLKDGGLPIGRILIGAGLVALAATGIGLAVAAPVGLAGAASITATLAAFGPGGMVGGVATLAALTGTAGVLTGVGVTDELNRNDPHVGATGLWAGQAVLARLDVEELGVALVGMLAVLHAQARLGFDSTEPETRIALSAALDDVVAEQQLHEAIAPGTKGTGRLVRRAELLGRALEALDDLGLDHTNTHREIRKTIEDPRRAADRELPGPLAELGRGD